MSVSLTDVLSGGSCPLALQKADLAAGERVPPLASELSRNPVTNVTEAQKMSGTEIPVTAELQVTVYGSSLLGGTGAWGGGGWLCGV